MIDPERGNELVPRPKIVLGQDTRDQYTEAIMPFVLAAREVYGPIRDHQAHLRFLSEEEARIRQQIEETPTPPDERHPLSIALTGIKLSRADLEHSSDLQGSREEFRLRANELIAEVNRWRARFAIDSGAVSQAAASLVARPQIPPARRRNAFIRPDSPVGPHNALGELPIYRSRRVRPELVTAIQFHSRIASGGSNPNFSEVSMAIVSLVPIQYVEVSRSTPEDLRRPTDLARQIVDISQLVGLYDAGLLPRPSADELGLPSAQQERHISDQLRALLAHFLRDELLNPHRTEKQIQDTYRSLSDFVRRTASHITPRGGNISSSYEQIGLIIDRVPGIEGPLLAARLSTNLYRDLGLPCIDYISEERVAEVLRNIGIEGHWVKGNRADMTVAGFRVSESTRMQFGKITESIGNRLDSDEINCHKLFKALESLKYGERVIENLFSIADSDQKVILLRALRETDCFEEIIHDLIRIHGDEDLDE